MKLLWIRYADIKPRYWLVAELGTKDGKLCCIDADQLAAEDKEYLKSKAKYLDIMDLSEKIKTIKRDRPSIMKCYRTISTTKFSIEKEYLISNASPAAKSQPDSTV